MYLPCFGWAPLVHLPCSGLRRQGRRQGRAVSAGVWLQALALCARVFHGTDAPHQLHTTCVLKAIPSDLVPHRPSLRPTRRLRGSGRVAARPRRAAAPRATPPGAPGRRLGRGESQNANGWNTTQGSSCQAHTRRLILWQFLMEVCIMFIIFFRWFRNRVREGFSHRWGQGVWRKDLLKWLLYTI